MPSGVDLLSVIVGTKVPDAIHFYLFGSHGSHIDYFFSGKRDQDFRTFPENLKGDFIFFLFKSSIFSGYGTH